jgi:murein L,D-transpeptidase YafK
MYRRILSLALSLGGLGFIANQGWADEASKAAESIQAQHQREMVFLLVDKSKLTADLMTMTEDNQQSERLFSFKIAIGKEEGDKQKMGDNRTPEGIYFSQRILNARKLGRKYGPFAIPIDFPNPLDRFLGKTGYGIWLHGVEADKRIEAAKVTEGCVAFYNADIQSLTQWLVPDQSVVVIAKDASTVNRPENVAKVRQLTQEWIDSWAKRDIEHYISLYHDSFKADGKDKKAYYDYKKRVFNKYKSMDIAMNNIRVFTHERYAVAVMNQDFNGDNQYRSYGRKILYWQLTGDDQWKLFHEEFDEKPMQFVNLSREKIAQIIKSSPSTKALQEHVESRL